MSAADFPYGTLKAAGITQASIAWSTRRRKIFSDEQVYLCSVRDILKVGSVWCTDVSWITRARGGKYVPVRDQILKQGWDYEKPILLGLGTNGFVSLIDGNHRVALLLMAGLAEHVSMISVKFHYFDIGDPINPAHPEQHWSGRNLYFICFPRGACGKCGPCRNMLPEVKSRLQAIGIDN